jgi:hypothetical protein
MTYRILSQSLWPLANSVKKYLKDNLGLDSIKVEQEIADGVPRPTLHARAENHSIVCAEFLEDTCFSPNLRLLVSLCKSKQLPVKLYVAYPEGTKRGSFSRDLKSARELSIGVLCVSSVGAVTSICEPISLVLSDMRPQNPKDFPPHYRSDLVQAHQTYLQGDPVKGCLGIYEMIEALTRRIAKNLHNNALIAPWQSGKPPKFDKDPWFNIADTIYRSLDFDKADALTKPLWAQVIAITKPRNDVGHLPRTMAERVKRDKELRTRFETAGDLLRNLIEATPNLGT